MIKKTCFILFILLSSFCTNEDIEDCELKMQAAGIIDFDLGTELEALLIQLNKHKTVKIEKTANLILIKDNLKYDDKILKIEYKLIFKNSVLTGYTFLIKIDKNRKGLELFKSFLEKVKKYNPFIKDGKYSHMKTTKTCKRFLRTHTVNSDKYIFGGIHSISNGSD